MFSFNFLPPDESKERPQSSTEALKVTNDLTHTSAVSTDEPGFLWIQDLPELFRESLGKECHYDVIPLGPEKTQSSSLKTVREASSHPEYKNSDLVSGVYEGGLKVWECSVDLCQYLHQHDIVVEGSVLELGCGHGLPGCLVLKQAMERGSSLIFVVFSDFNEFVLRDVTVANIVLNVGTFDHMNQAPENWLSEHCSMGAGDWNAMSIEMKTSATLPFPAPNGGTFDYIFAAETTYSAAAARDTATLIGHHLKPGSGIAFVATKRFYFGVGGGSDCFRGELPKNYQVEVLETYDNGAGNIRELLKVTSTIAL